jgi:hypothetical protein
MEKNKIIKKEYFDTYAFYQPYGEFKFLQKTKSEINIFGSQTALCISSDNLDCYIWFGISNDIFNTKKLRYDFESTIPSSQMKDLNSIANQFNINIENGYFQFNKNRYKNITLLFQHYFGKIYMMVYSSTRSREPQSLAEDMYGDDIMYVHGIWEVELLEQFKKNIFG